MPEKTLLAYDITVMPLADLKDNPKNPRIIRDTALKGWVASIEEFGLIEPIIWNKRTGFIVGGHQRKRALEAAGYENAQVLVVDFDAEKEMMANLSLNNPRIQGEFTETAATLIEEFSDKDAAKMADLCLDQLWEDLDTEKADATIKPEVPFTEEVFEEHNYVVLTFKNKADWVWLNSLFPLQTVKALDAEPGFEKQGVGRVVDGVKFLEAIQAAHP